MPAADAWPEFDDDVASAPSGRDLAVLAVLADDLTGLDYTVEGVEALLGPAAYAALGRDQLVPALLACRRAPGPDAARATPVLLWLLGETVTEQELTRAFPGVGVAGLEQLRLIERAPDVPGESTGASAPDHAGGGAPDGAGAGADAGAPHPSAAPRWRAAVELRPYSSDVGGHLWVASDLGSEQRPGPLPHDHVLGIGGASLTLAQTVLRTPVGRALDLGTGCGIQAFHLLAHADHVTVTDISDRALAFTRFNLLLNAPALGIDPERPGLRVSLRRGSLLEPVRGEEFDLVVSNPPFVITPRTGGTGQAYTYRDGGLAGDAIVSTLVRDLPGVLTPGGAAQLLGNWEITEGTPWDRRIRGFVPPGVDAWIIQREQLTPVQYAETWLRDAAEHRDREAYVAGFAAYLADFAARDVEGIGFGSVWLRRPRTPSDLTRVTLEEITHDIEQPVGPHLAAAIGRGDWLAAHTEQAASGIGIADEFLLVAEDVTEERHQKPGAEHPGVILLRQGAGLRRTTLLSTELAGFASACDGDLTAGQIAGALALLLDRPDAAFTSELLLDVEQLVREGFLLPAP
ncbi:SAM-dependent methyltransferase [Arthrobacter pityocampae]|uniref:SAM-dependent methyltransferase n=1 Tax=Arthrobacter pityocampae TaxID=547334 RepID=A0A2S5IX10_9MICC|nr:methyltransferase [Arthrobacter pityocampae]PPB49116.1 SAM-dependent methyltransferase [Arthrobacter pityocampae]